MGRGAEGTGGGTIEGGTGGGTEGGTGGGTEGGMLDEGGKDEG